VRADDRAEAGVPPSLAEHLRRVFRATGLLLAAVAVINGAVFAFLLWRLGPALDTTIGGAQAIRESHEGMLDQETGLRGYLLTDDEEFLEPYEAGLASMRASVAEADRRLASSSRFSGDLLAMRLAQQIWLDQWAARAATGPTFATEGALRRFLDEGRAAFDAYRVAEQRLIDGLVQERETLLARERAIIGVAGAGALVLGAALFAIASRERERLATLVTDPIEDLRATMQRIERGDLDARAAGSGSGEFAELAGSLDAMATQLAGARQLGREQAASLQARSDRQAEILTMARDVAGSLNLTYVLRSVAEHCQALIGADVASIWLVEDDDATLCEAWVHTDSSTAPGSGVVELGSGLVGEVARDGRSKTSDAAGTPAVAVGSGAVAAVAVPMIVGARVVGVLDARFTTPAPVDTEVVAMLEALASHGGTAIEAARLHETAKELSQIDALTRLHNRRRLDIDLATELARADRYDRPLAFVMADVDHFKQFNDLRAPAGRRGPPGAGPAARQRGPGVRHGVPVRRRGAVDPPPRDEPGGRRRAGRAPPGHHRAALRAAARAPRGDGLVRARGPGCGRHGPRSADQRRRRRPLRGQAGRAEPGGRRGHDGPQLSSGPTPSRP
jgi:HAMP domain-containing protein